MFVSNLNENSLKTISLPIAILSRKFITTRLYDMDSTILLIITISFSLVLDIYVFSALKKILNGKKSILRLSFKVGYVLLGISVLIAIILAVQLPRSENWVLKTFLLTLIAGNFLGKILAVLFLIVDDVKRFVKNILQRNSMPSEDENKISRSEFLTKASLVAAVLPLSVMGFGILSGAYDYRIRRKTIYLSNLPKSFDGIRLAQISDIHSGSFFNKTAVRGGVEMLMTEKPDVVCFTGDIVNNVSKELNGYIDVFEKVKAPLGVYSVLGNHDYGDYVQWPSVQAKRKNIENVITGHHQMNWDILLNENRTLMVDGEQISLMGIENWGTRFVKHGKLSLAYEGTQESPVKILMSHDPSHWDAQVRPLYSDIDLTLSGHTHGLQFGVEIGGFRWSPVQYIYKQWADLYQENNQYLYVNRGYGFIGYPGRIGILPEITILELKKV